MNFIISVNRLAIGSFGISALLMSGCALDAAPSDDVEGMEAVRQTEQAATIVMSTIYSFKDGNWRKTRISPGSSTGTTDAFSYGGANDIPLVAIGAWIQNDVIAVYEPDTGKFRIDLNGDHVMNEPNPPVFNTDAAPGDEPFILYAQAWERNSSNNCVPAMTVCVSLPCPRLEFQVGVKRGDTTYLDRDGDGKWGGTNNCDLSGSFAAADENVAVVWDETTGSQHVGSTAVRAGVRRWFKDLDDDLEWDSQVDFYGAPNGFGDPTDYAPPSNGGGISVQHGRNVYFDKNKDDAWSSSAYGETYPNVLPSSSWQLVGASWQLLVY